MIELDFLFMYEHKVRELENLCLIKSELDRRGYRTQICYIEEAENTLAVKPIYYAKVLLVMSCYDNQTLYWQSKKFVKFDKVIDMQWENIVYPKDEERVDAFKNYSGIGKDVVRVSWGKQNEKRMLDVVKMDPRKVKVVGHVGMDFLRHPLNRYYTSRKELFQKYGLDDQKETLLFASPYYGDQLDDEYIADMCRRFGDNWVDYYQFMCQSQEEVLQWMERLCEKYPDKQIVYRPHPGHPSRIARETEQKFSNFHIIADESVKQWIIACDKIYTGNSSVNVEAFFANKMCYLLFPYPVTRGFELKMIAESQKITDYEAFERSVFSEEGVFPTPQRCIEEIYLVDWSKPSYVRFADMAEEVLQDDYYRLTKEQIAAIRPARGIMGKAVDAMTGITPLYRLYLSMLEKENLQWHFLKGQRQKRKEVLEIERNHQFERTGKEEIERIINKIDHALEGGDQDE